MPGTVPSSLPPSMREQHKLLPLGVMNRGDAVRAAEMTSLLVVDDDQAVLRVTKKTLERRGYRVVACRSGDEALSILSRESFDCMISDVQMPGINGVRLLRAVRDRDLDLPVVLVTGNPDVETAAAAVEYGAFQYLIKPVGNDRLDETVQRAANAGRMARAKREYAEQYGSGVFLAGDRAGVDATLDRALASLWMAYQPIVRATGGSIFAQEALMRTEEPALPHPGAVLEAAERAGRLFDVGRLVRDKVAKTIAVSPQAWTFFVNLHPADLSDPSLYLTDAPLSRVAHRVVLEITERVSLETLPGVSGQIASLREMGFRIALDDLGAGYAGLTSFVRLEPEFVKLDMSLIRDVHQNEAKQKIIGSMVNLCHEMGKQIVAEGVEQAAERDALVELGCDFLQGYFFAKPGKLAQSERLYNAGAS
jgi:EAL domain-containing protein (putative c-di-GMP-specific phosphodiesterase class I)